MLLVHDDESQIGELHMLLKQSMSPYNEGQNPGLQSCQQFSPCLRPASAFEKRRLQSQGKEHSLPRRQMLFGEDLSWRHDGNLPPRLDHLQGCTERDYRPQFQTNLLPD